MTEIKRYGLITRPLNTLPRIAEMKRGEMVRYSDHLSAIKNMMLKSQHARTVKVWMHDCRRHENTIAKLRADLAAANARIAELEKQTCSDMECTIDQKLSDEQQKEWGLDQR